MQAGRRLKAVVRWCWDLVPSVQAKVGLLVLGLAAVTAVNSAIFIVQTRANIQAQVFHDQQAAARTYAGLVSEYLGGARAIVEAAARQPAVRAPIHPELRDVSRHGVPPDAEVERRRVLAALVADSVRLEGIMQVTTAGEPYLLERLHHHAYAAVVTDANLATGADGLTLIEEARRVWPDLRFVLASGSFEIDADHARARGAHALLRKPYQVDDLRRALGPGPA